MTPAYVATSIETRGENTAMIEMRSEEATVKTVVVDDTEERNNIIKQIKEVLGKINMNLKEILKASQARNKARLAELQGKVEKGEVRSEELATVKAEVEALTEEAKTLADEIAKLEEEEKEEDPDKKKDDDPEKKKIQQKRKPGY